MPFYKGFTEALIGVIGMLIGIGFGMLIEFQKACRLASWKLYEYSKHARRKK